MAQGPRFLSLAVIAAIVLTLSATASHGQADAPPERSAPESNDHSVVQDDQSEPLTTFKGGVDLVQLFFNVKDKKGALIPNLKKDDFQILEDGKQQTVKYFSANSDLPLTLGILIDASGSQQNVLDMEKQVGSAFLNDIIREKDLAFVMSFDVNIDLLQDFTSSTRKLKDALNSARINTGGGAAVAIPGTGGGPVPTAGAPRGTLLYDAIYLAAHDELAQQVGRKAMIILTDGADQGSKLRIQDAIEAAQKSDSIVYVLLIADRGFYGGFYGGDSEMKKLTRETGGRTIDVGNKFDKLKQAFDQIALELRSQYNVGYTPSNSVRDGSFRKVEVRAKDYKIQARAGYYARPAE
jgi:VWFA-related protein